MFRSQTVPRAGVKKRVLQTNRCWTVCPACLASLYRTRISLMRRSRKSSAQNGRRDNRMPARAPGQSCQWEASVVAAFADGITRLATTKETHFRSQTQVRLASGYGEHAMEGRVN